MNAKATKKLLALLLSLCMLLGGIPVTARVTDVPNAPEELDLEVTDSGIKASWTRAVSVGKLGIFEYEVTLFKGEEMLDKKTVQWATSCTFDVTAESTIGYGAEIRVREGVSGVGDPDNLTTYQVTDWTDWSNTTSVKYSSSSGETEVVNKYSTKVTGIVDVALPGSEQKLYKEDIGTSQYIEGNVDSEAVRAEIESVKTKLYAYFEENKGTVPALADVLKEDLTFVFTTVADGEPQFETVDGMTVATTTQTYQISLRYGKHNHIWSETYYKDNERHWKKCTVEGCTAITEEGAHQIEGGKCSVCGAEVINLNMKWEGTKVAWESDKELSLQSPVALEIGCILYRSEYEDSGKKLVVEKSVPENILGGTLWNDIDFTEYMTESGQYWVETTISVTRDGKKAEDFPYIFTGYDISSQKVFSGYTMVEKIKLENADTKVEIGKTPVFSATVAAGDQDKYQIYLEQWRGDNGKSITSQAYFNDRLSEAEKITKFEEGVSYTYDVWLKAKDGYAISQDAETYLNGERHWSSQLVSHDAEGESPAGGYFDVFVNNLWNEKCTFANLEVNGIPVTTANRNDVLGEADGAGATVYYNQETNTLTLDNATIKFQQGDGIWALDENFTIALKGKNQIIGEGEAFAPVYSHNNLTITGSGSLTASGACYGLYGNSTITIKDGAEVNLTVAHSSEGADQPLSAVRALGGLTVDGAVLNGKNNGPASEYLGAPGISTSLIAKNGAKVDIFSANGDAIPVSLTVSGKGTTVKATSGSSGHYGIAIEAESSFTISDGATVTASGGKGAMNRKPDLSGYTNPYIAAGAAADKAVEVTDPANAAYQNEKYVSITPTKSTEPTTPTEPTKPADTTPAIRLQAPAAKLQVNAKDIKLTWNKVNNAKGYVVYKKTGSGKLTKLATVYGAAKTSYTDKKVSSGKKYSYQIKAFNGGTYSSYSKAVTTLYLKAQKPAVKKVSGGIKVTYKKTTGATGYVIYRKAGKGKWTKIKTINKSKAGSYTDKKAKKGTSCQYMIKAKSGKYYSAYIASKKIKR